MIKKLLIILFILSIIQINVFAEEKDDSANNSTWGENTSVFNKGFENQEAVSDKKLKDVIDKLKERNLSKKQRKIRNEVKPLSPTFDLKHLEDFTQSQDPDNELSQTLTVMIPVEAYNENGIHISPGYYKLACQKVAENEYVLELSQGTKKVLTVKAQQTTEDLEQETIAFCNAEIIDNERIRLVYGSINLNLVGYLYFK
ncbi:MAG: hypothetical protein E7Z90_05495 [Cyanobacteria bacterium SIG29]|nr:hypothetical protein [Cyanobacteria bacterium SIG29]